MIWIIIIMIILAGYAWNQRNTYFQVTDLFATELCKIQDAEQGDIINIYLYDDNGTKVESKVVKM